MLKNTLLTLFLFVVTLGQTQEACNDLIRPNVVFIICDDLNDFGSVYGGHPQALTPRMSSFAESAVTFQHAYSNNPVCAPSRASIYTGIYPHTSNNLFWAKWFDNPVLKNSKTIMEFFKEHPGVNEEILEFAFVEAQMRRTDLALCPPNPIEV